MADSNIQSKKILIVEDNEVNSKIMEFQLGKYYLIDIAKNGEEAIELFSKNNYNLILMDINLGAGLNGIEVIKIIRESDKGNNTAVIAITAYANFGNKESFLNAGFDNYILKPYHSDDLLRSVMDTINIYSD